MTRRQLLGVWCLVSAAVTASHSSRAHAATQLFDWDCETGALDNYFNYNVHPASVLSTTKAHSGAQSIFYDPSLNTNGDLAVETEWSFGGWSWQDPVDEIYVSFWQWIPTTIDDGGAGAHGWRIKSGGGNAFNMIDSQITPGSKNGTTSIRWGLAVLDGSLSSGGYAIGTLYDAPLGEWFKLEIYAKLNTKGVSDGTLTVKVNGVQTYHSTTQQFRGASSTNYGWDDLSLNTNYDTHTGSNSYWYTDDLEIWDGLPPAGTAPAAPTNLRTVP